MKRIGLFGGSFDPVHNAHLALAGRALADLALDALRWVPAGRPWQKPDDLAAPEHRAAMVRLALADPTLGDPRFVFEDCELARSGPSFTVDTVEQLQADEPGAQWFLLIGQDQFARMHTWHRWRDLLGRVRLAVAQRPGIAPAIDPAVARHGHIALNLPPMEVSSTLLRERIAAGLAITGLVPAAVAGYIESHRLYRHGTDRHQPHRS